MNLDLLGLQLASPTVHPQANNFRPPSWPPPPDWSPILDAQGKPVCLYSDSIWPLDVWAGKPCKLNFGDGKTNRGASIDTQNADLLRHCTTWFMAGPRGCRTPGSLQDKFHTIKPLFVVCSQEGILASDLMRFEAVIDKVAAKVPPSNFYKIISILHDLLSVREHLGFCLLNRDGLARLAKMKPDHEKEQTPYIPSRIWVYQLNRLRECLQAYAEHRERIEDCFRFCVEAYALNRGTQKSAQTERAGRNRTPFRIRKSTGYFTYLGPFKLTADRFGITELLDDGMDSPACLRESRALVFIGVGIRSSNERSPTCMLLPLPLILQSPSFNSLWPTNTGASPKHSASRAPSSNAGS